MNNNQTNPTVGHNLNSEGVKQVAILLDTYAFAFLCDQFSTHRLGRDCRGRRASSSAGFRRPSWCGRGRATPPQWCAHNRRLRGFAGT